MNATTPTLPPPPMQTPPTQRRSHRGWWIAGIIAIVLVGGNVINRVSSETHAKAEVAAASPGPAAPSNDDADIEIMSIDNIWTEADLCGSYNEVRSVPNIDNYVVTQFEKGYGKALTPGGRQHLLAKLHAC